MFTSLCLSLSDPQRENEKDREREEADGDTCARRWARSTFACIECPFDVRKGQARGEGGTTRTRAQIVTKNRSIYKRK